MSELPITIEASGLTKRFGDLVAVRDLSFHVRKGEVVGFLGPNGAGKSTTIRILCGLLPASSGSAHICGLPVASQAHKIKPRIGYMPENNPLPPDMRVVEYLKYRGQLKGLPKKKLKERIDYVLEVCDLKRKARRRIIGTLSKGFRQRLGVADAILAEPEVIIMDEPTIGLDPHQVIHMRDLINSLRGKMTVILSSHILAEVEACCDQVIIINQGRVVTQGTPACLRAEFIRKATYALAFSGEPSEVEAAVHRVEKKARFLGQPGVADEDGFREWRLELPGTHDRGEELLRELHLEPGLRVRGLWHRHVSLEEIFLAATLRSWEQTVRLDRPKAPDTPATPAAATVEHPPSTDTLP